jgi:hypothetical protein
MTKEYIRKIALCCGIIFVSVLMVGQIVLADQQGWSQKFQCDGGKCPRFRLVLDGEAVLDKETLLVWEQSPSTDTGQWDVFQRYCHSINVGGRGGWRPPALEELRSLVDPTKEDPALPSGHPFSNVQLSTYWSATTRTHTSTTYKCGVFFADGGVDCDDKDTENNMWCVRGGQGYDAY